MFEDIDVRPVIKSDVAQLVELMNAQYNRKKNEKYFLWQYFNSYYPTVLMCAVAKTELVGMFGLQKRELNNGANVGQATDLLVSPDWRGQGIFKMLGAKAISYFDNLDLLCVLPNANGRNACEKALGWRTVGKIDSVILHKSSLKNIANKFSFADKGHESEDDLAKFKFETETRVWRFDNHPDYSYTYLALNDGEFAVVKIFTDPVSGTRFGDIVDFECDLNNRRLLRELFFKSIMYLSKKDVESITAWALPHTILREVVELLGFVDMPQERYFCLNVLKLEYNYLYDLSYWHLVQADSEIY